ncbi:MAG: ATP-binding protein [Candidatus Eremiobacteraeota bacterium]|nr:ATP-binding protein [Candidatus Eremiobacteraeota bacterium]MCW5870057.1 ATP-binding protein [Candidatus Eremiobacteraeota bacterium]
MNPSKGIYLDRHLDLAAMLASKSHFLLGPRQTGKTSLIRHSLPGVRVYDLLDATTFLALSREPGRLGQELISGEQQVVIDEIQRLPGLLNEVHRLIEERGVNFLLTGSSARKLRRGGVNLLGGRARTKRLHPLTYKELGSHFQIEAVVSRGTLPSVYFSDDPGADLEAYAGSYLQEEIMAEGATRNVPAFSRFLRVASQCNGTVVNFTQVASDAQVARTTVYEYFDILKDTLILHELPAWRKSASRKPLVSSKYYFFDVGVVATLQGRRFRAGTPEYGEAMETYLMHELVAHRDYAGGAPLACWRSASGYEVDFVLGDHTAVELKAKDTISAKDLRPLRALAEEGVMKRLLCVSLDRQPRLVDGIEVVPLTQFLQRLWEGEFNE